MTRPKRALITGGAGFIGSHLCERLLGEGAEVVCMDNLITGALSNVEHLFGEERFTFVHQDVTNFIHVPGELDYILHFASPASPIDYLELPIQTLKVGSLGTHKALGLAREKGARFLLASTSEVYGDPEVHPQREDYWGNVNPVGPRGVYDEAKRFAEAMHHGLPPLCTAWRPGSSGSSTPTVPRMRLNDGRVLPAFMSQALRGEDLTVFGDGSARPGASATWTTWSRGWSCCCCTATRRTAREHRQPARDDHPSSSARPSSRLTGSSSKFIEKPLPEDDPKVRQTRHQRRARRILDWEPKVPLEEGLQRT